MQGEIDAWKHHENDGYGIDPDAIEMTYACIMRRETPDRNCRKAMADGIEKGHASRPVSQATSHSQTKINIPQGFGGLGDAWC